ncbi:major facilitator superfamily transporter [Grosmannia clavigera kw1407]|uniref:Major facilitator superfamily transporter n=1 Tax=Grosmannia clavigera (strain kw1407 / UAMH 11150) TaxID=655863 RepID=F0XMQ3_GROCL|nr:major facilitator superfamily transporter [Grosmannia clavigera kw1407]EFX01151.1 major facilitator superfamily transporter [Grosmannia clavigera kw1407]
MASLDPIKVPFDSDLERTDTTVKNGAVISTGSDSEAPDAVDDEHTPHVLDHKAERALVRKFDMRLLPILAVMYLFNALDKSNLGNAKTAGLEKSLGLVGNQYNILLSVFFVPYVLTAPFLGILGKRFGPSRVLPIMMFSFGSFTLLTTAASNYAGIMTLRWFLGMSESAFFPLVIYYQTMFYRRGELARRLAIFYAASNIASAFSGLLAFGVFHIKSGHMANWRYLFVIEGSATVVFSVFAFFYLPASAAEATFLDEKEKQLAYHRMAVDSSGIVNEPFVWREAFRIFREPTSWAILGIEICLGVPLQSVSLFLPQIIARLKYSTVKTNLYTVAPNVSGAAMLLILAFASDYTRLRFPFVVAGFLFTFIGFVIYAAIDVETDLHVAYFACFMMTWGTSAPSVLLDVLYNNNIVHEGRRVVLTSFGVPVANVMGLVSSNIFRKQDAPRYLPALATTAAFGGTGAVLTFLLGMYMIFDNKRRDRKQGFKVKAKDIPTEKLYNGPSSPDFRWFL